MAPPFIAVTLEAKRKIPPAARLAQVDEAKFGWGLVCLWEWCWEEKADTATPDHLEAFFGTDGARMVRALVAFGFAELLDDGTVRVKGADRYLRISEAKVEGGKARAAGAKRDERGRLTSRNTSRNTSSRPAEHQQPPALSPTIDDRDLPFLPSEGKGRGAASPPAPPSSETDALCDSMPAAFAKAKGAAYAWTRRDDDALRQLLRLSSGDAAEVLRRWEIALAWVGFPLCASLRDLAEKWNAYAQPQPQARAGPARDIRRGVARAEDQDHSKTKVMADGTVDF